MRGHDTKVSELSGSREQNWTISGFEREFASIKRLKTSRGGVCLSFQREKRPPDRQIDRKNRAFFWTVAFGTLKIVFHLELPSAEASP
jgi:hypothetical protein